MVRKFEVLETQLTNSTIMYRIIRSVSEAAVSGTTTEESWGSRVADVWTDAADAKLLAAAPDLLDKLKQLVAAVDIIPIPYASAITREARELINQIEESK